MNSTHGFLDITLKRKDKRRMQSEAANRVRQDKSCLNTFEGNEHFLASYDNLHYVSNISNVKHYLNVRENIRNVIITYKLVRNGK